MNEKRKIIIVEDDLDFAKMVKIRLEKVGYRVIIALDTYLGMREIVKNDPDLVILDLMLPAGGGFALLERLRNNPSTVTLPAIILTGKTIDDEVRAKANEFDVVELFQKTYDPAAFVERVMKVVPA